MFPTTWLPFDCQRQCNGGSPTFLIAKTKGMIFQNKSDLRPKVL